MDRYCANQSATVQILLLLSVLYALSLLVKAVFQFFQTFCFNMGAVRGLEDARRQLLSKCHTCGMRYFDQTPAGSIVSRVLNELKSFSDFEYEFCAVMFGLFSVISSLSIMLSANPKMSCCVSAFYSILLVVVWYTSTYSSKVTRHMRVKCSVQ